MKIKFVLIVFYNILSVSIAFSQKDVIDCDHLPKEKCEIFYDTLNAINKRIEAFKQNPVGQSVPNTVNLRLAINERNTHLISKLYKPVNLPGGKTIELEFKYENLLCHEKVNGKTTALWTVAKLSNSTSTNIVIKPTPILNAKYEQTIVLEGYTIDVAYPDGIKKTSFNIVRNQYGAINMQLNP